MNHGAVVLGAGGVDDDVGCFVEDDEMVVFKQDINGDIFGLDFVRRGGWDDDINDIAETKFRGGLGGFAVDARAAAGDQVGEFGPAHEGDAGGQVSVESATEVALEGEPDSAALLRDGIVVEVALDGVIGRTDGVRIDLAARTDERWYRFF